MPTRMTEAEWDVVVTVFRAVRSRRGDKGRHDRKFLQAIHSSLPKQSIAAASASSRPSASSSASSASLSDARRRHKPMALSSHSE